MRRQLKKSPYGTLYIKQLIGKGSYGQIYKAFADAQNKQYAVKIISADTQSDSLINIERQIKILMSCNHPNIVKCHSVQIIDEMVWIVMDYYSRGSLADIMSRERRTFKENQIKNIIYDITNALAYLHDKKIIHRDIKAANILVDNNGVVKVADFGVSTLVSHSHKHTRTGSPLWMSPQLLSNSNYSFKTDIWSLGITTLQLAEGVPPYSHQHPYRAIFSIQAHPPQSLSEPHKWSAQFNNFVNKCLTLDQNKRPSARQLLKHQFLINNKQSMGLALQKNESLSIFTNNQKSKEYIEIGSNKSCRQRNAETVIFHQQFEQGFWQKNSNSFIIHQTEKSEQNDEIYGTFKINDLQSHGQNLNPCLLAQITKKLPETHNKQNYLIQQDSVESLYAQMELQIKKIRKKYLSKIREIQKRQIITFSSQLNRKKQKNTAFKHSTIINEQ